MPLEFGSFVAQHTQPGASEVFERFVAQVARLDRPDARQVALAQGDGGLDVIAGDLSGDVEVWQAKFYRPKLTASHTKKIETSFAKARDTVTKAGGRITRWTLCVPVGLDPERQKWWAALSASFAATVPCRLWDHTAFEQRLLAPDGRDVRSAYFDLDDPTSDFRVTPPALVGEADPSLLGVKTAVEASTQPAYVARDLDATLRSAMVDGAFVVLSGDSAAGKSRTVLEALVDRRATDEIAAPHPDALSKLEARVERLRDGRFDAGLVVWFEDVDAFLRARDGLTPKRIATLLAAPRTLIVATIRREMLNRVRAGGGSAVAVLDRAEILALPSSLTAPERRAFRDRHPARDLGAASLGEHFLATRHLKERYEGAPDDVRRLVEVTIDWQRVTADRALPVPVAAELLGGRVGGGIDEAEVEAVARRAAGSEQPGDQLLFVVEGSLRAADYLVDHDDRVLAGGRQRRPVHEDHWLPVIGAVSPETALDVAAAARAAGLADAATAALEKAVRSSDAAVRAAALLRLGDTIVDQHPDVAARRWFSAVDTGSDTVVVAAARRLVDHVADDDDFDVAALEPVQARLHSCVDLRDEADRLLARIADRREDVEALDELFARLEHTSSPALVDVARFLGRKSYEEGDPRAYEILLIAFGLDGVHGLGHDAVTLAGYLLADDQPEEAADVLTEAAGLYLEDVADGVHDLTVHFEDIGREDLLTPAHRILAEAGDRRSRSYLEGLKTPTDPDTRLHDGEESERSGDRARARGDLTDALFHYGQASELGRASARLKQREVEREHHEVEGKRFEDAGNALDALELWEQAAVHDVLGAAAEVRRLRGQIAYEDALSFLARGETPDPELFMRAHLAGVPGAAGHLARLADRALAEARELESEGRTDLARGFYEQAAVFGSEEAEARLRELDEGA